MREEPSHEWKEETSQNNIEKLSQTYGIKYDVNKEDAVREEWYTTQLSRETKGGDEKTASEAKGEEEKIASEAIEMESPYQKLGFRPLK